MPVTFIARVCYILLFYACENDNFNLENDVLSSFFSQNGLGMSLSGRCLTEAILTSNLFFKENNKMKVIY